MYVYEMNMMYEHAQISIYICLPKYIYEWKLSLHFEDLKDTSP